MLERQGWTDGQVEESASRPAPPDKPLGLRLVVPLLRGLRLGGTKGTPFAGRDQSTNRGDEGRPRNFFGQAPVRRRGVARELCGPDERSPGRGSQWLRQSRRPRQGHLRAQGK